MNKSRRSRWSSRVSRTEVGPGTGGRMGRTERLARAAGLGRGAAAMEHLESRQLLDAIVITGGMGQIPVGGGLFAAVVSFSYSLPWLVREIPEEVEDPMTERRFADFSDELVFGGQVLFVGPIGARAEFFDLANRAFRLGVLDTRLPQGEQADPMDPPPVPSIDADDNGIPDFNYGIGRIVITNTNQNSVFVITGGLTINQPGQLNIPLSQTLATRTLYDTFEDAGFGLEAVAETGGEPMAVGLPSDAPGTIFIGSPWLRDVTAADASVQELAFAGFTASNQGIFVNGGASMGRIFVDGMLFGSSVFTGALAELSVGSLLGSVRVDGDLGVLSSAQDAGVWFSDINTDDLTSTNPVQSTGARVTVGRTMRSIDVGGRNGLTVTVLGDINNPARAVLNFRDYTSREVVLGFNPANMPTEFVNSSLTGLVNGQRTFGSGFYRNDTIGSAEYIGFNGTSVRVFGTAGGGDPENTAADNNDIYAFAADPTREVVITGHSPGYMRVVDKDGRVVANQSGGSRAGRGPGFDSLATILRFRPERADVYYVIISTNFMGAPIGASYNFTITGMAPTVVGSVRSALFVGTDDTFDTPPFSLIVSNGSLGAFRVGTSFFEGRTGGEASDFGGIINTNQNDPQRLQGWGISTVSVAGSIFNLWAGGNVGSAGDATSLAPQVSTGGDLGTLVTGQSGVIGRNTVTNGDLSAISLRIGGTIGLLDIEGSLGARYNSPQVDSTVGPVTIRTGLTLDSKGHIGQILVGNWLAGSAVSIVTPGGSQIDQMIVGDGDPESGDGEFFGHIRTQPDIRMGAGSDFRFLDYRLLVNQSNANQVVVIGYGQTLRLVDDAGAEYTISISGGDPLLPGQTGPTPPRAGSSAVIRFLPIDLSQGVALGRIDATLRGGANLVINGVEAGVATLGRIVVDAEYDDGGGEIPAGGRRSNIIFNGATQIDVGRIEVIAGTVDLIENQTAGGDIVAIDAIALDRVSILSGNLGRTETSGVGASLLGPFLGIASSSGGGREVGSPLGIFVSTGQGVPATIAFWNGALFSPTTTANFLGPGGALDEIGSPIDPYLNGVVVRNGDLREVRVSGAVGDVLVEGGNVLSVVANTDNATAEGNFDGIVGSIYANNIGTVDVGDGLLGAGPSALAQAGIFASGTVFLVTGTRRPNVRIEGLIIASSAFGATTLVDPGGLANFTTAVRGVGMVTIGNAQGRAVYDRVFIGAMRLDDWWATVTVPGEDRNFTGDLTELLGTNADLFGSELLGDRILRVVLTGGAYDATQIRSPGSIGVVMADEFRNSTLLNPAATRFDSIMVATVGIDRIETNGLAGDISDLVVDVAGSVTGRIAGRDIVRLTVQVNNVVASIEASRNLLTSTLNAGQVQQVIVGGSMRSSSLRVAGPIQRVSVAGEITSMVFESTGPDAFIGQIISGGILNANIFSAGSIDTIESTGSDIIADINTRDDLLRNNNGGITLIRAARDIIGDIRMFGPTGQIIAGRHIGSRTAMNMLDLRGTVGSITAGGQIYQSVIIGQGVTGEIRIGRVKMRPFNDEVSNASIVAFGRINALIVDGDLGADVTSRSGGIGSVRITNGSLRQGRTILAENGSIGEVVITGGHLLGNIIADGDIQAVRLVRGDDGFLGHIGVSPALATNVQWLNDVRNQLPPGTLATTGRDGALIKAGGDIGEVSTAGMGGAWESRIIAGHDIGVVNIGGRFRNDFNTVGRHNAIVAGNRIGSVTIGNVVRGLNIVAGARSLGADDAVGGTGANADEIGPGSIGPVRFNGARVGFTSVIAGIVPTAGGVYSPTLSTRALGTSSIESVTATGVVNNVQALSAGFLGPTSAGILRGGQTLAAVDTSLVAFGASPGEVGLPQGTEFNITGGKAVFSGPGTAFWDAALNRIRLRDTNASTSLIVTANGGGTFTSLLIQANVSSSIGTLTINGGLAGDSIVYLAAGIGTLTLGAVDLSSAGVIGSAGNIDSITSGSFAAGQLVGQNVGTLTVNGNFGSAGDDDAAAEFRSLGTLTISGALQGTISSDEGITSVMVGSVSGGGIRSGEAIGTVTVNGPAAFFRLSARTSLGPVTINGEVRDSDILAGADLGTDADFGGSGSAADTLGNGSITNVSINGNFIRSNIAAGVLLGASGFFGRSDQRVASGRSTIGPVTISGNTIGSTVNSQRYRIISTGTVGLVTVGGVPTTVKGNFRVEALGAAAVPVTVNSLSVVSASRIFTALITFNQAIDESTLSSALSIAEVRNGGATLLPLTEGVDYTIAYDESFNQARITFSQTLTERTVAQAMFLPGPGVYRFTIDADTLRGSSISSRLDGNGDGVAGDDYVAATVIGDAGDRTTPITVTNMPNPGDPTINLFGAADLDQIMRSSGFAGAGPETNRDFTIRGSVGDHPNVNAINFAAGSDTDVYRISLKAGQILRLGSLEGIATAAGVSLWDSSGAIIASALQSLGQITDGTDPTGTSYLVTMTGTYYIAVNATSTSIDPAALLSNVDPIAGAFGAYSFDVQVFDDNDTGFHGDTASGQGAALVEPPLPWAFRGPDNTVGTQDDLDEVTINGWRFTLTKVSPDASPTANGTVILGTNALGWTSKRTLKAGKDEIIITAPSAIDSRNGGGSPIDIRQDADVYVLNNGQTVEPGTKYRVTMKLAQDGSNIGILPTFADRNGTVIEQPFGFLGQSLFGLFEFSGSGLSDAKLVAAPSEFLPVGQSERLFSDGRTRYGYDANGDFFMEFVIPGSMATGDPASYAIFVQGTLHSNYTLEVRNLGTGFATQAASQNILIETQGGLVDWLDALPGRTTEIDRFTSRILGFQGVINGMPVDQYIISNLVTGLRSLFTAAGVVVDVQTDTSQFAARPHEFSTVFLTNEPPSGLAAQSATQFGVSEHVDAFNADKTDEAVVFASDFAVFGFDPSQAQVDQFIAGLTAAVGQRIGELLGLRVEAFSSGSPPSIMSRIAVFNAVSGNTPAFTNQLNPLATPGQTLTTGFYLGSQNAFELLRQVVKRV